MKYVKGYDTIRAFAVIFVIIHHWGPVFPAHTTADFLMKTFIPNGAFGVNLFFVLSGFLITSILLNERNKATDDKKIGIIKNFFVRRALRIFPIYYLMMFVLLIMGFPYLQEHLGYFLFYASNLLPFKYGKVNPLIHTWSLAVEEQFYLIWPWLIIFVKEKHMKYVFWLAIIVGMLSKVFVMYVLHNPFTTLVVNCFDAFGLGGLYAYMRLESERCRKFESRYLILFCCMLFFAWKIWGYAGSPVGIIYIRTMDSFVSLAIIMFVTKNKNQWLNKYFLENKTLNYIGRISYGLYLYHYVLGSYYDSYIEYWSKTYAGFPKLLSNFYISYCIKLTLLLLICALSFKFIEQPILRLKKKFEYR